MWITKSKEMTFKQGDLVWLHSGVPEMNLERIEKNAIVCIWFDKQDNLKTDAFVAKNLVKTVSIH